MEWQDAVDLSQFIVSAAPFGGPIGCTERISSTCIYLMAGLDAPPSRWVIMPHDRGSSLLVAIDNLLYLTEKGQCNRLIVSFSAGVPVTSIIEMAISYNYEYVAMLTGTGLLWIGSADLQKVYCEYNTSCPSRPKQLTWERIC
ncbi:Vacuolar protein sorting-associated protein 16 [Porites harrisoni]